MTERTFRTPSPNRPGSSASGQQRSQFANEDMPPVPALPQNLDAASRPTGRAAQQDVQHRKANSLSLVGSPVRLASQKLASGETPTWFGAAKLGDLGSVRRTDPAMASPPSSPLLVAGQEDPSDGARPGSQASSINFSYPTRQRCGSAASALPPIDSSSAPQLSTKASPTQPSAADHHPTTRARQYPRGPAAVPLARRQSTSSSSDQALVYDPNSRRMVRQADLRSIQQVQQSVLDASQQPVGPKRKKRTPQRAGSHLAAGTMGRPRSEAPSTDPLVKAQPSSPAAQNQPRPVQPAPSILPAPPHETRLDVEELAPKAIMASPGKEAREVGQHNAQTTVDHPGANHLTVRAPASAAPDTAPLVVRRQPSVIQEGPEPEDAQDTNKTQAAISDSPGAVVARRKLQTGVPPETRTPATPPQNVTIPSNPSSENQTPAPVDQRPEVGPVDLSDYWKLNPGAAEHGRAAHISRERTHSSSPARQAHFGPVLDILTVKHSPPPRSISPRKSAMKHTSPRSASPSGDTSEASGSVNQEPPVAPKKSVRVSFEDNGDGATGESAAGKRNDSPLVASPNRHSWLPSLGRNRELSSFDEDTVMKPRPALPSFGSVRDRKPRENSPSELERPLVRPRGETKQASPSTLLPSPPLGSSNDHAVGAVLSNENTSLRERAVGSEDASGQREPLPPVVTTVEGSGYFSDGSDSSSMLSSEFEPAQPPSPLSDTEPRPQPVVESQTVPPKEPANGSVTNPRTETVSPQAAVEQGTPSEPQIPAISVSQPTPIVSEDKPSGQYFTDLPGAFPDDESDQSTASGAKRLAQAATAVKPVESTEATPDNGLPQQSAFPPIEPTAAEGSSNSDSDVYSDAYEDLSEFEGDGFQSLNAVVESPVQQSPRPVAQSQPPSREIPIQATSEDTPRLQTEISSATTAVEPQPDELTRDDWEQAKAYWRSLTAEKRAQLEKETKEEAGTEGDKDEAQPEVKPKKKKTVERRNSERKALAVHMAQQAAAPQQQEKVVHPDRSYMIKPGERWTGEEELTISPMRKTMRAEPQQQAPVAPIAGSRLRKSMRANGSGLGNGHAPQAAETRLASKRPESTPVAVAPTKPGHRRSATQVEERVQPAQPALRRRDSTGSESSFKRARPTKSQGLSFRHSMRSESPPRTRGENQPSKRFSLRTLSPAGSVSPSRAQMRTTLRDSSAGKKTSSGMRMPSFSLSYGGGKKSGSKASSNRATGSRFSSRLADSSDEDGDKGVESGFRSRFEDSSDDEPVLPIPASLPKSVLAPSAGSGILSHHLTKASSVASTALTEELEESEASQDHHHHNGPTLQTQPNSSPVNTTLRRTRSGKGQLPASQTAPSLSRPQPTADNITTGKEGRASRRHSILSVLRHRKKDSNSGAAAGKIGRPEVSESAARRDTRLERSVGQLERIRSRGEGEDEELGEDEEVLPSVPSPRSPRSPKLQKRGSHHRASSSPTPPLATTTSPLTTTTTPTATTGNNTTEMTMLMRVAEEEDDHDQFDPASLTRRPTASGNLGTRTLGLGRRSSSGDGGHVSVSGGGGGGFLHRRMSGVGGLPSSTSSTGGGFGGGGGVGGDVGSVDGGSVAGGSLAGASSTTRRKRFGALRKMLGLNE